MKKLALLATPVPVLLGLVAFFVLPDASSRLTSRGHATVGCDGVDSALAAGAGKNARATKSARATDRVALDSRNTSNTLVAGSEAVAAGSETAATAKNAANVTTAATHPGAATPSTGADKASALERIRAGLHSADPKTRLAAIRAARDLHSPELQADVVALLATEQSLPVKRVAAQALAQGDPASCAPLLHTLEQDPDPIVKLNAGYGLARAGDENEQARLLVMCETARKSGPAVLAVVASALEDPALRSPAVIARFQSVASNPNVPAATRDHALAVVQAKMGRP